MREISAEQCFKCLRSGHFAPKCWSKSRCMHCRGMHSLLRLTVSESANVQATLTDVPHAFDVLLVTAWVNLHTAEGRCVKVRALFDQGSIFSFISESLCWTSRTTRQCADLQIRFGKNYTGHTKSKILLGLTRYNKPIFPLTAYVFNNFTSYTASAVGPLEWWPHLRGLSWRILIQRVGNRFIC